MRQRIKFSCGLGEKFTSLFSKRLLVTLILSSALHSTKTSAGTIFSTPTVKCESPAIYATASPLAKLRDAVAIGSILQPLLKNILKYLPILHDDLQVVAIHDNVQVLHRIAVDEQKIGKSAFFDPAKYTGIRVALSR